MMCSSAGVRLTPAASASALLAARRAATMTMTRRRMGRPNAASRLRRLLRWSVGAFLELLEGVVVARIVGLEGLSLALQSDHRLVLVAVANDRHRLQAALDAIRLLQQKLVVENHAAIAGREMLARAIGDGTLSDPGEAVLNWDGVAGDLAVLVEELHVLDGDRHRRCARLALGGAIQNLNRMRVVDRHANLKARRIRAALRQRCREEQRMPDHPVVGGFGLPFEQPALVDAVFEHIERDLHVPRRIHRRRTTALLFLIIAEPGVEKFEMHWIGGVVHALQPIAR